MNNRSVALSRADLVFFDCSSAFASRLKLNLIIIGPTQRLLNVIENFK